MNEIALRRLNFQNKKEKGWKQAKKIYNVQEKWKEAFYAHKSQAGNE
ncbi:hypothetical protein bpmyx0001_9240 [Bacillus pseudomycoides DSM 12442]|nr:hypothetical protein bpmyx0001_9240 [Bacillus pseudomycoides DSM 12442]